LLFPPNLRPVSLSLAWSRPRQALGRWVSLRMSALLRARLWQLLGSSRRPVPSQEDAALGRLPPVPWRRPPVLLAAEKPPLPSQVSPLPWESWPVFAVSPAAHGKVRLAPLANPGEREAPQVLPPQALPRLWAAPLGVVLPAQEEDASFAQWLSRATGYALGPSVPRLVAQEGDQGSFSLARLFPLVSILLVTHNQRELTQLCLQSPYLFTDYPHWEVVAVDNASQDGTAELLSQWQKAQANFQLVVNRSNLGFPQACNQAAELARGEFFCLLNNDTVVSPGWLSCLMEELLRDPRVGLVGPVSQGVANEARVKVPYTSLESLPFWAVYRSQRHARCGRPIPMLALYCVVTPRRVWKEVGGLDPAFGLGLFEDDDFSHRIRRAGYEIRCRLDAFVHHFQSASFSLLSNTGYLRIYEHNRKLFLQKKRQKKGAP